MTVTKASRTPASPVRPKKAVNKAKYTTARASGFEEEDNIDSLLQGINHHRRFARRGSKTPQMLKFSCSKLISDNNFKSAEEYNPSANMTLVRALRLNFKLRKDADNNLNTRGTR